MTFLQLTSFGTSRAIHVRLCFEFDITIFYIFLNFEKKWIAMQKNDSLSPFHQLRDSESLLGRIIRQKVRISRERMLESTIKVMEMYGSSKAMLEVEFFDEFGTGLVNYFNLFNFVGIYHITKSVYVYNLFRVLL